MLPERFYSTEDIRRHCEYHTHWFDASSMRFFDSRIGSNVYPTNNPYITLFVSSERFDEKTKRYYSIRSYDSRTHDIDTIGEFQQYDSSRQANREAKRIAATIEPTLDELHDYALAINAEYDSRKRRALHRGEKGFVLYEVNSTNGWIAIPQQEIAE